MKRVAKAEAEAAVVVEDARGLWRETFDIQSRLRRNPYAMVAGAVGIGFVLGGGLFTRLAAKVLGVGLRTGLMAGLPIFQKEIAQALTGSKLNPKKETHQ
jgi:hypothetical protein